MRKANLSEIIQEKWSSPNGKFSSAGKTLNELIAPECASTDLTKRHPFEVELARLPAGVANFPYHWHSAQWEFYIVLSGTASVRHADGTTEVGPGDFFMFGPGEAHQFSNHSDTDLVYYVIADNPTSDHCYYPDSDKWAVGMPGKRKVIRGEAVDYFVGEDESRSPGVPSKWVNETTP